MCQCSSMCSVQVLNRITITCYLFHNYFMLFISYTYHELLQTYQQSFGEVPLKILCFFAATGSSRASQCDTAGARKFGYASVTFIIIGLVVGCVAWGIIIWWLVVDVFDCNWSIYGYCYKYRYCYYSSSYCYGNFYSSVYYYDCCYYNY
jgi:hypothetical protein